MAYGSTLFWRETHKRPRFLIFDGRIVALLLLMIMHMRIWTFALVVIAMLVLWFFERKGVSADSIVRFLRSSIVGRRRTARGPHAERMPVDFGFETAADVRVMRNFIETRTRAVAATRSKQKKNKK